MTTDNTNEAAKIAGELSAEVLSALQTVANGNSYMSDSMWNYLEREGLVESTRIDGKMVELITSHGLAVLAVSVKAPQRETEITAAESFVKGDTVYKVNANPQDLIPNGTKGVVQDVSLYNACVSVDFEGYGSKVIVARNLSHTEGQPPAESEKPVIPEFLASMTLEARQEFVRRFNENPTYTIPLEALTEEQRRKNRESYELAKQPPSATAADSGADVPNPFDEIDGVGYAIAMIRTEFIGKKDGQEAIWSHIHTIEDAWQEAQAELTALRAQLEASQDTVRGLRLLCGRAVAFESMSVPFSKILGFTESLQQAAKGGDE